ATADRAAHSDRGSPFPQLLERWRGWVRLHDKWPLSADARCPRPRLSDAHYYIEVAEQFWLSFVATANVDPHRMQADRQLWELNEDRFPWFDRRDLERLVNPSAY